ncbi:MAG: FAD/NAD(P)-binding protein [Lysobacteraceae bacterium]|nr:MAG: FAD/NAD(P)-binding protein [Xanthomonadaceae bacterium]
MNADRVALVGGGPLCVYALERLAALFRAQPPAAPLEISVFERSGEFGAGETHSGAQSPTSALNRVASQIAFAADESHPEAVALLPKSLRPTFYEWAREKFQRDGDTYFDMRPEDVPARCQHGIALRDMFGRYVALLREIPGVRVELRAEEVVDVERVVEGEGAGFLLHAVNGDAQRAYRADRILFATGPARRRFALPLAASAPGARTPCYVPHPYPLHLSLDESAVPPGCRLGVLGLGLTAIDAMLFLTEGRGGHFFDDGNVLRYAPSGREPARIVAASTSGMFTWCRPRNEKALDGSGQTHTRREHQGVFISTDVVDALRMRVGRPALIGSETVRQLDFDRHILPLIVLEMAYLYYATAFGADFAARAREAVAHAHARFLQAPDAMPVEAAIEALLAPVQETFAAWPRAVSGRESTPRFDWRAMFEPLGAGVGADDWHERVVDFVRRDNRAALEGNLHNPMKAACDGVWRDLRPVLAQIVDFGGLTAESHRRFCEVHFRRYTRMSNGTGPTAMRKIQALLEAGLIDAAVGPSPRIEYLAQTGGFRMVGELTMIERTVDVLLEGRVPVFDPAQEAGPLYPNLLRRGLIRHWRNPGPDGADYLPGAIDVNRRFHPIDAAGREIPELTFFGAPTEGVAFFQLSAARPYANSPVLNLALRWANETVAALRAAHMPATT